MKQNESFKEDKRLMYEIGLYQWLSKWIEKETNQITTMVNLVQKYRYEIKHDLEMIAYETFNNMHKDVKAHIYGSVATNLMLPESDMDIVITGVNSYQCQQSHKANISTLFEQICWLFDETVMPERKKILSTQVPIIKLKFNLSEYYDRCLQDDNKSLPYVNFESIDSMNPHLKQLSVDISISDDLNSTDHLGIQQSYYINQKIKEYPVLRPVCLVLKKLLVNNGLNDPYTGGLGSFSLFLMLYLALSQENLTSSQRFQGESTYLARLFSWFLHYFGETFNREQQFIYFNNSGWPWVSQSLLLSIEGSLNKNLLCVYDPFNSSNNTAQKAFRIKDIFDCFKQAKDKITIEYSSMYRSKTIGEEDLLSKVIN